MNHEQTLTKVFFKKSGKELKKARKQIETLPASYLTVIKILLILITMELDLNNGIMRLCCKLLVAFTANYQNRDVFSDLFWKCVDILSYILFYNITVALLVAVISSVLNAKEFKILLWQVWNNAGLLLLILCILLIVKLCYGKEIMDKVTFGAVVLALLSYGLITSEVIDEPIKLGYGGQVACSFFKGYLFYILPKDGVSSHGIVETITKYEADNHAEIPVKKLFLIFTESLHCPPDLSNFNQDYGPQMEAAGHLEEVRRKFSGVETSYRNPVYKIHKENGEKVYVVAECPTPLQNIKNEKARKSVYTMMSDTDFDYIFEEFRATILQLLEDCPECKDQFEIINYDDMNRKLNLAQVILNRIDELNDMESKTESALSGGGSVGQDPGANGSLGAFWTMKTNAENSSKRPPSTKKIK